MGGREAAAIGTSRAGEAVLPSLGGSWAAGPGLGCSTAAWGCWWPLPSSCRVMGPGSGSSVARGCRGVLPSSVSLSSQDEVTTAETTRNEAAPSLLLVAWLLPAVALRGEGDGASPCFSSRGAADPLAARSGSATPVTVDDCDVVGGTASGSSCPCPCPCPFSRCCCCFWACCHAGLNADKASTAAADLATLVAPPLLFRGLATAGVAAAGVAP